MDIQVERTHLGGLSVEVKQNKHVIHIRPVVNNIHELIEELLVQEGLQLTKHTIRTMRIMNRLKNDEISAKEAYMKLSPRVKMLETVIEERKKIRDTIKFFIKQDKFLLDNIEKTIKEERKNDKTCYMQSK